MTETTTSARPTVRQRALKWGGIVGGILLVLFLGIRLGGTGTYEGTIQRVYEKVDDYRVEIALSDGGEVRVLQNSEARFPYFKFDTADLQAELGRYEATGDLVRVRAWGFRSALFSWFPNVIDVELIESGTERRARAAEHTVDVVLATLESRGALKDELAAADARTKLRAALVEAISTNPPKETSPEE